MITDEETVALESLSHLSKLTYLVKGRARIAPSSVWNQFPAFNILPSDIKMFSWGISQLMPFSNLLWPASGSLNRITTVHVWPFPYGFLGTRHHHLHVFIFLTNSSFMSINHWYFKKSVHLPKHIDPQFVVSTLSSCWGDLAVGGLHILYCMQLLLMEGIHTAHQQMRKRTSFDQHPTWGFAVRGVSSTVGYCSYYLLLISHSLGWW